MKMNCEIKLQVIGTCSDPKYYKLCNDDNDMGDVEVTETDVLFEGYIVKRHTLPYNNERLYKFTYNGNEQNGIITEETSGLKFIFVFFEDDINIRGPILICCEDYPDDSMRTSRLWFKRLDDDNLWIRMNDIHNVANVCTLFIERERLKSKLEYYPNIIPVNKQLLIEWKYNALIKRCYNNNDIMRLLDILSGKLMILDTSKVLISKIYKPEGTISPRRISVNKLGNLLTFTYFIIKSNDGQIIRTLLLEFHLGPQVRLYLDLLRECYIFYNNYEKGIEIVPTLIITCNQYKYYSLYYFVNNQWVVINLSNTSPLNIEYQTTLINLLQDINNIPTPTKTTLLSKFFITNQINNNLELQGKII